MKIISLVVLVFFSSCLATASLTGQEKDLSGIELSIDQDYLVDMFRNGPVHDRNFAIGLRIGFYGTYADHIYLGLPFVRQKIDGFLIDRLLYSSGFREENTSHNFVFTVNGFSPSHISNEIVEFQQALDDGYRLGYDRPFSSFTGFRSTRRVQGNKLFVHTTRQLDLAINTSFTFGLASLGLAHGVEDSFGRNRPDGNLWNNDETMPYPTGQLMPKAFPILMYSVSIEAVVWKPIKKILLQVRPEVNLGYYTNIGVGIDFGKVMNVERHIDNLSYTDTNNPSLLVVNDDNLGFSLVGGITARAVLYNGHLNGLYNGNDGHFYSLGETKTLMAEAYIGTKIQLFKKIELSFCVNGRTSEFSAPNNGTTWWGTFGMKYLMAPEGEGCYN